MVKGFKQIASLTMISRVLGMIRDICYSRYFGATALGDAWLIAFRIPNLSRRIFGDGAAATSFIPIYSEMLERDKKTAATLANTLATVIFSVLSIIVLLSWLGIGLYKTYGGGTQETSLILSLTSLMLPYAVIICTVAILAGMLNVHQHFAMPAAAPIILNVFIISSMIIAASIFKTKPTALVYVAATAVMAAAFVKLATHLYVLKRKGVLIRPAFELRTNAFKKVLILMGPMILGATATQLNTLADDMMAWIFSGSDIKGAEMIVYGKTIAYPLWRGCVMQLYLAQRLYQLPLGVLGIALATAIYPVLSRAAAKGDNNELIKTVVQGLKFAFFLAVPCALGLCLIAMPLISIMFEGKEFTHHDTVLTTQILYCYAFGLVGFFFQQIITKAFYSLQDSKMPAKTAIIAVLTNILLNLTLIWFMGAAGLALATAICSYLQVIILLIVLKNRYQDSFQSSDLTSLIKVIVAAAAMFAAGKATILALDFIEWNVLNNITRVAATAAVAGGTYYLMSVILKIEMLNMLFARKKP